MEKELNIAAILKEKPENTRLWSPIFGDVYLKDVTDVNDNMIRVAHHGVIDTFLNNGKVWVDGNVCLFPSKQMRDWSKFAWKKGDVLIDGCNNYSIFVDFDKGTGLANVILDFLCNLGDSVVDYDGGKSSYPTQDWSKATGEEAQKVITHIEKYLNGKLNLETLKIEQPKQEFKDGGIVVLDKATKENLSKIVAIYKTATFDGFNSYTYLNVSRQEIVFGYQALCFGRVLRPATEEEKQQLFDALAKKNKRWNPDTKQIEDLPKKCEFKPFDKVLVRDFGDKEWKADFFSHKRFIGTDYCFSCVGNMWKYCIPYNEETKHLLGTTDEWEGDNNV